MNPAETEKAPLKLQLTIASAPPDGPLSYREWEVLQLAALGATNRQIASTLVIAEATARFHIGSLLRKLGADNRTQAVALARRQGLLN